MPGNLENASITRKRRISIPINTLHEFGGGNLARGRVVDHQSARALSLDLVDRVPGFFARSAAKEVRCRPEPMRTSQASLPWLSLGVRPCWRSIAQWLATIRTFG